MLHPLLGVRVKIDRAKKHLRDLDAAIRAFKARDPHGVITKKDPQSEYETYCFCEREPIPVEWGAIVGDCIHNLRSSLDLLANALIIHNGSVPNERYARFPISSAGQHVANDIASGLAGASSKTKQIVARLKPYDGGNDAFWRLHQIDIRDKHRLLIPVASLNTKFGFRWDIRGPGMDHIPPDVMRRGSPISTKFPLKDGDVLMAYRRIVDAVVQDKSEFEFVFDIAFGDGQIFDREPVVPTLQQLVDFTERVVDIFDRHIFR